MGFKTSDRNQNYILGYSYSDFVEDNSKERFVVNIVENLNTNQLYNRYSNQGGEALDPKIMLATWFLGYCYGITSSRKLEYNCKRNLDFIYISGNLRPDHTTLNRFRQRNLDLMQGYFVEILLEAARLGVSDFNEISIDGTKIGSVSSKKKSVRSEKLARQITKVTEEIANYLQSTEADNPPEELLREKKKLDSAKAEIEKRKSVIRKEYRDSHQVNIEEPDAVMQSLGSSRGSFPGYNAQVSTDTKSQLITSSEILQDRNDEKQFIRQWKRTEKNLGRNRHRKYVADGGYNSNDIIDQVNCNKIDAYIGARHKMIPTKEKIIEGKKFTKDDYVYDREREQYICPAGKALKYIKRERGKTFSGKKYRSDDCEGCNLKQFCLSKNNLSGRRELSRDEREDQIEAMKEKTTSSYGKAIMMRRQTTVEATIGNIKSNMGYSRFRLKGLEAVNAEFVLMCIGHNLNKLFKLSWAFIFNSYNTSFKKLSRFYCMWDSNEIPRLNYTFE
ncbi:MAG: IS1182 family transposase [Melioribacteraceae bacterium]|nr:IS1182 family transposase [Melioribacteraceae bacterium]MCF8266114.1 IS1182 family transposase [Melioribacteraceae bacterium]MCF8431504.1 IS1182 family transposase [Melioribacteraceae bacterium]